MRRSALLALLAAFLGCAASPAPTATPATPSGAVTSAPEPRAAAAGPETIHIDATTFSMGSDDGRRNERPAHDVSVKAFDIDRLETTVAGYAACVTAGKCAAPVPPPGKDRFCNWGKTERAQDPINCIDWNEARIYCEFRGKRLPTEAEWELAARGTDGRRWPWGNTPPGTRELCWHRLQGEQGTCPVGSFPDGASPYGVLDLAGNVSEWTADHLCPYSTPDCKTEDYVGRGGSWDYSNAANVTATGRLGGPADHKRDLLGVRCAR
jgi:formylglycine-generating enzyme required for sulfatase activity